MIYCCSGVQKISSWNDYKGNSEMCDNNKLNGTCSRTLCTYNIVMLYKISRVKNVSMVTIYITLDLSEGKDKNG